MHSSFWKRLEKLVSSTKLVIDRPKGTAHPRYPEVVYPLDYGYLEGTTAADGGGIDVWRGSDLNAVLDAIVCTVDSLKKDTEIKLLLGCTQDEKKVVLQFHHNNYMAAILVERNSDRSLTLFFFCVVMFFVF